MEHEIFSLFICIIVNVFIETIKANRNIEENVKENGEGGKKKLTS